MSEAVSQLLSERAKAEGWWHHVPPAIKGWDQQLFEAIRYQNSDTWLYAFTDLMVHRWPGILLIMALLVWLFSIDHQKSPQTLRLRTREVMLFVIVLAVANVISDELKMLFGRLKPHVSQDVPGAKQPLSFPSNHSFNTAAILGYWLFRLRHVRDRKRWLAIGILTLLWAFTAWARVYLGEHFPIDVLAGFGFGIVYGFYGTWLLSLALWSMGNRPQN